MINNDFFNVSGATDNILRPHHMGDVGFDLIAASDPEIEETYIQYRTGVHIEPSHGLFSLLFPRSSISKTNLVLANSVGVIDNGYRGEILVRFKYVFGASEDSVNLDKIYKKGDKIAQLVFLSARTPRMICAGELGQTERNKDGFGSTGS